jgi:hypothetical protein
LAALEGRTLLDELNHRIKNEFASVINLVSFKAIWTDNADAKEELSNVVDLLHQHVEVHNILTMPDGDALVDAGDQLRKLGLAMSRCKLDRMNIHLLLSIDTLALESERCWRLALAVYEVLADCVVSTAAAWPMFAASKLAPRPTATPAIVTIAMAMAVATGTGRMRRRRRRVTPTADPMAPPRTAATTPPPTGNTAPGASWCVMEMETD